jgi:hypothetical protein
VEPHLMEPKVGAVEIYTDEPMADVVDPLPMGPYENSVPSKLMEPMADVVGGSSSD